MQGVVQAFKDRQISGGADRAGIGRKAIKYNRDAAFRHLTTAQERQTQHLVGQCLNPLMAGGHGLGLSRPSAGMGAALAAIRAVAA